MGWLTPRGAARPGLLLLAQALLLPQPASAQELELRGYYLNVATGSVEGPFTPSGVSDFQRLRLMIDPDLGPLRTDVAYEHSLSLVSDPQLGLVPGLGDIETGTSWLPLQWTIAEGDNAEWRHRFDRLLVGLPIGDDFQLDVGRQPISWATTLFLTPADPFAPFDPADPFREYRGGVDAARFQGFLGAFTGVDAVLRLADTRDGTTVTALGRAQGAAGSWELSGWAGAVHDEASASVAATLTAAGAAFRGELVLRDSEEKGLVPRLAVGADRSFPLAGRDLYLAAEYQHDGFGAANADEIPGVVLSDPFARGELQVVGRDETALQASWQAHPLLTTGLLWLWNLGDRSALLVPAASWSVSNEVTVRAGLFLGIGSNRTETGLPGSEYGPVPTSLYLSLTAFF
jgi:hypothetical protein